MTKFDLLRVNTSNSCYSTHRRYDPFPETSGGYVRNCKRGYLLAALTPNSSHHFFCSISTFARMCSLYSHVDTTIRAVASWNVRTYVVGCCIFLIGPNYELNSSDADILGIGWRLK